jgi:hypothetical protein
MSGNTTGNMEHLIRAELWSSTLKDILTDEMMAQRFVDTLTGFPDGDTFTIPSIGQLTVSDYTEDTAITYTPMDTGEFQFVIDQYLQSGTSITKKAMQDAFYSQQMISRFVPKMERAIMTHFENTTFAAPEVGVAENSRELINNIPHRWAAGGTGASVAVDDFIKARYALKKLNVPDTNLIAVVDPSVEETMNSLSNLTDMSYNPRWEGIVTSGIATGMKFIRNIYGFDVYTSNYLKDITDSALPTAGGSNVDFSSDNGKCNLFFSASPEVLPFVGAWRQQPEVDYEYNKDFQRHEYAMTARYGVRLYWPENMVRVVSKEAVFG